MKSIFQWGVVLSFVLLLNISVIPPALAQTTCGTITDQFGTVKPINNCLNPFNTTPTTPSIGDLTIDSQTINEGGNITVALNQPLTTTIQIAPHTFSYQLDVYQKVGQDFVYQDGFRMFDTPALTFLKAGTYTAVITVNPAPILIQQTLFQKLLAFFVPTAYANIIMPAPGGTTEVKAVTFEVIDANTTASLGSSNILFLPGIQASRLYADRQIVVPGYDPVGVNEKVWEPSNNGDVLALQMTDTGRSVNKIHTKDVIDQLPVTGANIYKGFINFLQGIGSPFGGPVVETFPYDWRYDVFDVVKDGVSIGNGEYKYPTSTLAFLAGTSPTGKVTIIAHSNGGLLAKAIMMELEKEGKANLVDKIIFIGTPQLGTPKAIGTILHGYDQQILHGRVVDSGIARSVIKNLPGVYSLLPSEAYIQKVNQPLVSFDNSVTTKSFRDFYGFGVNGLSEYKDFMNGVENPDTRTTVALEAVNEPTVVNANMFSTALLNHKNLLDDWTPATSTEVYKIIGTGLNTMKAVEYREIKEKKCTTAFIFDCTPTIYLKPYAQLTHYGDETVISSSAEGVTSSTGVFYVDLQNAGDQPFVLDRKHADLTESPIIQELVLDLITGSSTNNINFVSTTEPVFTDIYNVEIIDSPVQISATDNYGNVSGLVDEGGVLIEKEEIQGSSYFEFGGTKYLVIPKMVNHTTFLRGEDYGSYTLTVAELDSSDTQTTRTILKDSRTTPNMVATYSVASGTYSFIQTDLNGDSVIDSITTMNGTEIEDVDEDDEHDDDYEDKGKDKDKVKKDKPDKKHKNKKNKEEKKEKHKDKKSKYSEDDD